MNTETERLDLYASQLRPDDQVEENGGALLTVRTVESCGMWIILTMRRYGVLRGEMMVRVRANSWVVAFRAVSA